MTILWTCDVDESDVEERCKKDATHLVTWYDEADVAENRAGHTMKVCDEHRDAVRFVVWETPSIVDVGIARIDRRPSNSA